VLEDFLTRNRAVLIDRCRSMCADRSDTGTIRDDLANGIPLFLDRLVATLRIEDRCHPSRRDQDPDSRRNMEETAALPARDPPNPGRTLEHVVRDYGNFCQAVMNLAYQTGAPIEVGEFHTFNRCLDDAIAAAVTEHARRQTVAAIRDGKPAATPRHGPPAEELRNYLETATLAVQAIKAGNVGISGATGAVLDRSLLGMRNFIDRPLAEVPVADAMPARA
jgi:hypothetical protein